MFWNVLALNFGADELSNQKNLQWCLTIQTSLCQCDRKNGKCTSLLFLPIYIIYTFSFSSAHLLQVGSYSFFNIIKIHSLQLWSKRFNTEPFSRKALFTLSKCWGLEWWLSIANNTCALLNCWVIWYWEQCWIVIQTWKRQAGGW